MKANRIKTTLRMAAAQILGPFGGNLALLAELRIEKKMNLLVLVLVCMT